MFVLIYGRKKLLSEREGRKWHFKCIAYGQAVKSKPLVEYTYVSVMTCGNVKILAISVTIQTRNIKCLKRSSSLLESFIVIGILIHQQEIRAAKRKAPT